MVSEIIPDHFLLVLVGKHHPLICVQAVNVVFPLMGARTNVEEFCVGVTALDVDEPRSLSNSCFFNGGQFGASDFQALT